MSAYIAKPQIGSSLQHRWKIENMPNGDYLVPVLFQGPMTSELLDSLLCVQSGITELCLCYDSDDCHNPYTHKHASDDNTDVVYDDLNNE